MPLYEEMKKGDIFTPLHEAVKAGVIPPMDLDGVFRPKFYIDPSELWIHAKHDVKRQCGKWNRLYYPFFRFIPKGCRNCWKVTMKPKTLKQAIDVMMLQEKMDLHSKTGMEMRPYTAAEGGFSSFWYAPLDGGLDGGRELHRTIATALKESFGDEVNAPVLKRGCTEMEMTFPPSSSWDKYAQDGEWDKIEWMLEEVVIAYVGPERQPPIMKRRNLCRWIEWGFEHSTITGDETYKNYIDGKKSVITPLEYYNGSIHSIKDFKTTWEEKDGNDSDESIDTEAGIGKLSNGTESKDRDASRKQSLIEKV